jgi:hypothetical protein
MSQKEGRLRLPDTRYGYPRSAKGSVRPRNSLGTIVVRVFIDTSVASASGRPLESNQVRRLLDETRRGNLRLVLPEVAVREAANLWAEKLVEQMRAARSAQAFLLKAGVSADEPCTIEDRMELRATEEGRIRSTLAEAGAQIAPLPACDHGRVVERALLRIQPFDPHGRNGYRDVLIWESLLELEPNEGPIIFLAKDKRAFFEEGKGEKGLAQTLRKESAGRFGPQGVRLFSDPKAGIDEALAIGVRESKRQAARAADQEALDRLEDLRRSTPGFMGFLADEVGEALEFMGLGGDLGAYGVPVEVYDSHVSCYVGMFNQEFSETHVVEDGTVLTKLIADVLASADAAMHPSVAAALEGHWQVVIRDRGSATNMATASIDVGIRVTADLIVDLAAKRLAAPPTIVRLEALEPDDLLELGTKELEVGARP